MGLRQQWQRALDMAVQRGQLPAEVVSDAVESMGARPEADLTPALIAFWVELAEDDLAVLLHEVQTAEAIDVAAATRIEPPTAKAAASWAPGQTLGEFELLEQLGQGGMGQVFRARQRSLARDVALKVLAPGLVGDPES